MSRLENSNAQRTIQNYRSFFINKSATTILIRGAAAAAALDSLDSPNRVAEEHLIQVQMKQLPDKQMRIRERHPTNPMKLSFFALCCRVRFLMAVVVLHSTMMTRAVYFIRQFNAALYLAKKRQSCSRGITSSHSVKPRVSQASQRVSEAELRFQSSW